MTRDIAVSIAEMHGLGSEWIDFLSTLGLLKLEEPKTATDAFREIVSRHAKPEQVEPIMGALKNSGFRIVEADK